MKALTTLLLFVLCITGYSQTVLLNVDRNSEERIVDHGPNLRKFTHLYVRGGVLASQDYEGARIIYGPSVNLAIGVRTKFKISPFYSLGYEIENDYTDYKFKQEEGKRFPDTIKNDVSRLDYSALCFSFFNRFNFDPGRGNYIGNYLDIGITGEWDYSVKSIVKNDLPDGTLEKVILRHLNYVYNLNAKIYARIGISHFSYIYVSYRLLDLFKPEYSYPDLPRVVAGVEIGIF